MNIAFIPVRGGSKSIPLKNIKNFCGKPLVFWAANAAQNSSEIDEIVIATDSLKIKKEVLSFGFNKLKVYDRNSKNAEDISSTESVMLEYIQSQRIDISHNFILIQATSPFIQEEDITRSIKQFKKSNKDSLLSCSIIKRFFWDESGKPINYNFNNRPRRQDFRGTLIENGALYINTVNNIIKFKNRLSGDVDIYVMPEFTAVEIDEPDDWILAEHLMRKHVLNKNKRKIKLVISDVDGVLTDAGMYYSESGDELKKFNTHDGMGFQLLRERGYKIAIITSENTKIVERRVKKLQVDYLCQGKKFGGKLNAAKKICNELNISINEVAYIGDDINCLDLLNSCGLAACPQNATTNVKNIPNITILERKGGEGVFREFVELILNQ